MNATLEPKLPDAPAEARRSARRPECQPPSGVRNRRSQAFVFFGVLLTAAFVHPLIGLAQHAAGTDLHSHILLIPFVSAYLIYERRRQWPTDYQTSALGTIAFLGVGLFALAASFALPRSEIFLSWNDYLALNVLSYLSFLLAGGWFFLGRKWMAANTFPLAFLFFTIPLPDRVVAFLEMLSTLGSTNAAHGFFMLFGLPTLREGAVFHLPGIVLEVAKECSGIRSSWVLFITSVLAAHVFLRTTWRRLFLVAFVIPLGLLRNGFRILVLGWLCVNVSPEMIHSLIHKRGGPLFFVLSLIPLFGLLWWLRRGENARGAAARSQ